ncbi:hypothetical protein ACROYT_G003069 [Oculina patagonica]
MEPTLSPASRWYDLITCQTTVVALRELAGHLEHQDRASSKSENQESTTTLENDKAPGPDGISPEALKIDMKSSVDSLHKLFEKIWNTEQIPKDWKCGHLVKLPRKGA